MKYEISQETVEALIKYLSSRPYAEVYQGIQLLSNLKSIPEIEVLKNNA